ncbi:MAG TPA: ABC transporter permease [Acidimicrobiia bacterium]
MSTSYAVHDSMTMLRRQFVHMRRYPVTIFLVVVIPIVMLLLFVYVFGATLGAGLNAGSGGRAEYVNYVVPGILLMAVALSAQGPAISVAMDMSEGIIARFKTMAIARVSVLSGHVLGNVISTMLGLVVLIGVALLIGFRPSANPMEWLAAIGVLAMVSYAVTWFSVGCGLAAKTVESASNLPTPLILLPFLGSGFVPTESMPPVLGWFAEFQPFTPFGETLRALLMGTPMGNSGLLTVAWCVAITLVCYLWSKRLYNRDPSP